MSTMENASCVCDFDLLTVQSYKEDPDCLTCMNVNFVREAAFENQKAALEKHKRQASSFFQLFFLSLFSTTIESPIQH